MNKEVHKPATRITERLPRVNEIPEWRLRYIHGPLLLADATVAAANTYNWSQSHDPVNLAITALLLSAGFVDVYYMWYRDGDKDIYRLTNSVLRRIDNLRK